MNQTCDRCGPAVRAAYRVDRGGELYADAAPASSGWRCPRKAGPSGPRSRAGHVECRAPRLCRLVPNRVIRRLPNRVIGAGVAYVAGHGLHDAAGNRWHRPGVRHLAYCHEELLQPAAVGYVGAHRAHAAPATSAPDTGTGLIAGSISLGSQDGDSPGPARPWEPVATARSYSAVSPGRTAVEAQDWPQTRTGGRSGSGR
jgi:hypothetical protein